MALFDTTLAAAATATQVKLLVAAAAPRDGGFYIQIDEEILLVERGGNVTRRYANTDATRIEWQVKRAQLGTTAAAHDNGEAVREVIPSVATAAPADPPASEPGGGGSQTLAEVLTEGNDAGGLDITGAGDILGEAGVLIRGADGGSGVAGGDAELFAGTGHAEAGAGASVTALGGSAAGADGKVAIQTDGSNGLAGQLLTADGAGTATWAANAAVPTARTITAGAGLIGGGDLSANRTVAVDFGEVGDISTQAFGDAAAAGASGEVADAAHKHGMPAVVRGRVAANGTASAGSGFTSAKIGTGHYRLTFSPAFAAAPIITVSVNQDAPFDGDAQLTAVIESDTVTTSVVDIWISTGATVTDCIFTFIAVAV